MANPLISDREIDFELYEVHDVLGLCKLPYFADHSRETFDLFTKTVRRFSREVLYPTYKPMDEAPPYLKDGKIITPAITKELFPKLVDLGIITASKSVEVGGQQMPLAINAAALLYLNAGNLGAIGWAELSGGAAHLVEVFGSEELKKTYMEKLYAGEWTGTMALTEPQAGSSLADITTRGRPHKDGYYLMDGAKMFISGGDNDFAENVVHLALGRIEGAPPGVKGISLFLIPKLRPEGGKLVPNDVKVTQAIHKIGYRGICSLGLAFGEDGDCRGWLVGEPNKGLAHMFQMMNEARVNVGCAATATASVAYHESLDYAQTRCQGRPAAAKDPKSPQVPIIEHAEIKRMLLRQKAIVEGAISLMLVSAYQQDLSEHGETPEVRKRAALFTDLLTPIAKAYPSEFGFESNVLAIQVLGGYGYSSEYLPESWMRDQKLNSIHEGTDQIQAQDLLGRKVQMEGGAALKILMEEIATAIEKAKKAGVDPALIERLGKAANQVVEVTAHLAAKGKKGDVAGMMLHTEDYRDAFSLLVVGWLWLRQATAAMEGKKKDPASLDFYEGKLCAAQFFLFNELGKVDAFLEQCRLGEDSYAKMKIAWY